MRCSKYSSRRLSHDEKTFCVALWNSIASPSKLLPKLSFLQLDTFRFRRASSADIAWLSCQSKSHFLLYLHKILFTQQLETLAADAVLHFAFNLHWLNMPLILTRVSSTKIYSSWKNVLVRWHFSFTWTAWDAFVFIKPVFFEARVLKNAIFCMNARMALIVLRAVRS